MFRNSAAKIAARGLYAETVERLFFPVNKQVAKAHDGCKQDPGDRPYNPGRFPSVRPKAKAEIYGGCGQPIDRRDGFFDPACSFFSQRKFALF